MSAIGRDRRQSPPVEPTRPSGTPAARKNPTPCRAKTTDFVQKVVDEVLKNKQVQNVNVSVNATYEWKYFASSEGSYIEQETWLTSPSFSVTARKDDVVRTRNYSGISMTGGWEVAEAAKMLENAERIAAEAVEFAAAKPIDMGVKDLILTPAHAMLTIHEIVAHPTELDRIMGYEANYAGTSFVKSRTSAIEDGYSVQRDRGSPIPAASERRLRHDGVKTTNFPIVRDGILVGCRPTAKRRTTSTKRKAAAARRPARGATIRSCGCRTCTSTPADPARRRRNRSSPTPRTAS